MDVSFCLSKIGACKVHADSVLDYKGVKNPY